MTDELTNLETLPGPLLVDNMSNEASIAFGSFPDRLYIVLDGKIVYMVCILNKNVIDVRILVYREEWDLMVIIHLKLRNGLTTIFHEYQVHIF